MKPFRKAINDEEQLVAILYLSDRTKRYEYFKKWFVRWHRILKDYENNWNGEDLPYWCTERTNIGHLSLAAYDINGYPLQEYSTQRRRQAKGPGRADLYVEFPRRSFNLEAKQAWPALLGENSNQIKRALKSATGDFRSLTKGERAKKGLSLVFAIPYRKITDTNKKYLIDFRKRMQSIDKTLEADFLAIHFADYNLSKRVSMRYPEKDGHYWYPGIAIIGRWIS